MMGFEVVQGDCLDVMTGMADNSVDCCVTSPPYWGLRDYGDSRQIGLEQSPGEFVARLVGVFQEVKRVLRDSGTLWVVMGDSYSINSPAGQGDSGQMRGGSVPTKRGFGFSPRARAGVAPKNLMGMPWRLALALQEDGWILRQDIIWHKQNCIPESVKDRFCRAHEHVFLLSKGRRYWFDSAAAVEPGANAARGSAKRKQDAIQRALLPGDSKVNQGLQRAGQERHPETRKMRDVWSLPCQPFRGEHFAPFPPALVARCIRCGCPAGGTVLDPFAGSGTTGMVAAQNGRDAVLVELNTEYADIARERCGIFMKECAV